MVKNNEESFSVKVVEEANFCEPVSCLNTFDPLRHVAAASLIG